MAHGIHTYPSVVLRVLDDEIALLDTSTGLGWSCRMSPQDWADLGNLIYMTHAPDLQSFTDDDAPPVPVQPTSTLVGIDGRRLEFTGDPEEQQIRLFVPSGPSGKALALNVPLDAWDALVGHRLKHAETHGSM